PFLPTSPGTDRTSAPAGPTAAPLVHAAETRGRSPARRGAERGRSATGCPGRPRRETDVERTGVLLTDPRRPRRQALPHLQDSHDGRQLRIADRAALVAARRPARHAGRLGPAQDAPRRIAAAAQRAQGRDESD